MRKKTPPYHNVVLKEYRRVFIEPDKGLTEKEKTICKWFTEFTMYKSKYYYDKSKRVIGRIAYFTIKECSKYRAVAIGISVRDRYRNKGYASMMVRKITKFLENSKKYKFLYAYIMNDNEYGLYSKKSFLSNGYIKSTVANDCIYYNKYPGE